MERQGGAEVGDNAQISAALDLIERDDVAALADREHGGGIDLGGQMLHIGPCDRRNVPEAAHAAAVLEQAQAERIPSILPLRDNIVAAHGRQETENRAFRQTGLRADGGERHWLAGGIEKLQKLHRFGDGKDNVAVRHEKPPLCVCLF